LVNRREFKMTFYFIWLFLKDMKVDFVEENEPVIGTLDDLA